VPVSEAVDQPSLRRRFLATDDTGTFARVLGIVALLWVLDVVTRGAADGAPDAAGSSLTWWALRSNPAAWLALTTGLVVLLLGQRRSRTLAGWDQLEHGHALRLFAMPLVVLSVWYHAFYSYNFFLQEWHHIDRLLIIGFAVAAWWRPIFLLPLVLVARIVDAQYLVPLVQTPASHIGELPLMCLLVVAASVIGHAIHGDRRLSGVVLVTSAVVASHFFEPGLGKIALRWATESDPGRVRPSLLHGRMARSRRRHLVGFARVDRRHAAGPDHRRDTPAGGRRAGRRGQPPPASMVAGGLDTPAHGDLRNVRILALRVGGGRAAAPRTAVAT
jgi:hypothetical protein